MKFNNVHNECIILPDGREIWIGRSVAVTSVVMIHVLDYKKDTLTTKYLINQRGEKTPDFRGHWNIPCGYIDKNETSEEAAIRETYEETGLDVSKFERITEDGQPFYVNSLPTSNRQNIVHYHMFYSVMDLDKFINFCEGITFEHSEPGEVVDARFITIDEVDNYQFCFGHKERLIAIHKKYSDVR
ncbi:MAG: NUDIX hydrolase [Candidatus Pacearchaeota archaeon]|jgi:8-oxo-dGTP pyrophosphatase MutT (NUDIX family)|nr:NUDIX hydrolase [Clostridia bacterium]